MKRGLLFSLAMGLFLTGSLMAAGTAIPGHATTALVGDTGNDSVIAVVGATVPVYALPDPYFHPSYNPADGSGITAGFTWDWTASGGFTLGQDQANDNYVAITAGNTAGDFTLSVIETPPPAYGTCTDAGTSIPVVIFDSVDAALTVTGGTAPYAYCEGNGNLPTAVDITITDGFKDYRLAWELEIKTLDTDGSDKDFYATDKATTATPLAITHSEATPDTKASNGVYDITDVAYTVIDNSTTVYTYTLASINDLSLRMSDFILLSGDGSDDSAFSYKTIGDQVAITVYPTPVTGPIYHIPTSWEN